MAYDIYGNYTPDQETEEERKKREAEQAAAQAQRFPPAGPVAPSAVNYGLSTGQEQPGLRYGNVQAAAPVAPVAPQQTAPTDQAAYTAQMESGANPNIEYHFPQNAQGQRKSTAFGMFGLTAPAYADIQQANAKFANRPITSLTPEEQTQAYQTYTDLNKQRLQGMGVEPTDANARLAHFLGASGAAKYLQTGEISPQAAAANGGLENAIRIAEQRLAGGQAPASGAAQQPAEQPAAQPTEQPTPVQQGIDAYQNAQNDMNALFKLGIDQNVPANIQERARDRALELYNQEKNMKQAQQQLTQLTPNEMARTLTKKSEGTGVGDWLQYLLLKHVGLTDLANQKGEQLGIGHQWQTAYIQDSDGNNVPVEVQTSASGRVLQGIKIGTNAPLSVPELQQAAGGIQDLQQTKTLQTQAHQSAARAMDEMRKINTELIASNRPPQFTEDQVLQRGREVYDQTMRVNRPGLIGAARTSLVPGTPQAGAPGTQPIPTATPGVQQENTAQYKDTQGNPSKVFENWYTQRVGEGIKESGKRMAIQPSQVDSMANAFATGQLKPSQVTGKQSDLRSLAEQRALEINPKYTPQLYDTIEATKKNLASGKDHDTIQNTGTSIGHLLDFKAIAATTPGATDVSSWNTFIQNVQKYGNAPEIKSKEAMAEFVAGELVKAASGGKGGVEERISLAKKLMTANTPAEMAMMVDSSIGLAYERYNQMRSSFIGQTGLKKQDFDNLAGLNDKALDAFNKIDAQRTIAKQGTAAEQWARANPNDPKAAEILRRLGKQ